MDTQERLRRMHEQLLGQFATSQRRRGLRPNTIDQRDRFLRRVLLEFDVHTVTAADIEAWLDAQKGRRGEGITPKTRSIYLSYLSAFFEWMADQGLRADDPVRKISRPRLARRLPKPAAVVDLDRALAGASLMMRCWLLLAAYQGFRCFEVAGLRREDVLDGQDPPLLLVDDGKGGHQRMLPLNPVVLAALRAYGMPPLGPVFVKNGKPYTPNAVSKKVRAHMQTSNVSATAHRWRHTFGSEVYRLTRDLRLTQELMGHADPSTTAGYVAINPAAAGIEVVSGFGSAAVDDGGRGLDDGGGGVGTGGAGRHEERCESAERAAAHRDEAVGELVVLEGEPDRSDDDR